MTSPADFSRITRREALAGALGAATLAVTVQGQAHEPARQSSSRPNFLFIMADDLGYADLSCYGRREYRTPALDSLAAQGMQFHHGYANSAVCSSTRVGLITGRYQYRLPVGMEEPLSNSELGLEPAHPTLPSLLRAAGYHTALIGKWHLGGLPNFSPLKSGYDEFWGNRGGGVDYFTHKVAGRADLWDGDVPVEAIGYYTDLLADRALEFLTDRAAQPDKPWLLSMHFTAPHWPWEGNDAMGRSESERLDALPAGSDLNIVHYDGGTMDTYAAMVTNLDGNIGRILAQLAQHGMAQDTVVVFTSDNGGERFADTWPFTGRKTQLLEGGIRVPLIVRWPGLTAPGSTSDAPVMSMDFMPTFLAAAATAPDPALPPDGVDIRPALFGTALPDRPMFWRYWDRDQRALRLGRYKYLKINENEFLFDVIADPMERGNLKDRLPDVFAQLRSEWERIDGQMLQQPDARSYGFSPSQLADHFAPEPR
ncbi:MAG: sulfatase-like hydrolase/transferase [Pseudomonadota bacterium]